MSSFQGVKIEGFHCIQMCPRWNRGVPLYTEVSSFQGVGIEEFPLYTEVSSFQGVGIEEFHCIRGVLISGCWNRGVPLYTEVS